LIVNQSTAMATTKKRKLPILDARPDTLDFRDEMYVPNLYEVPTTIPLKEYTKWKVPILDQGEEGACTGFGLATVANYLLHRRKVMPDVKPVSPRMIFEMAKRYDEWPGEDYSGSSARGAMKGWHKHGICGEDCWPYRVKKESNRLNEARTSDALKRPLGAYYRVNHQDLVAMHTAMAEVGILFATCTVHAGWGQIDTDGIIPYSDKLEGGHAFAIVAYDSKGFWIQNSWGADWGKKGFALISYDDWLANGTDAWVARLGAPVTLNRTASTAISHAPAAGKSEAYSYADLRAHIISVGNNGALKPGGNFGTSAEEVEAIFEEDFPAATKDWKKKRLMLYAHGGLVSETAAVQRLADYRAALLKAEVYPISFIWHSDTWTTVTNVLKEAVSRRKPEGFIDAAKDFMLDRLDDALEPIARLATGKLQWDEMKENAMAATQRTNGAARIALQYVAVLANEYKDDFEIHVVGHSAGSIFHGPLIQLLTAKGKINSGILKGSTGLGLKVNTCTLWAPACTIAQFKEMYLPAINNKTVQQFALYTLTDKAEQNDHCGHVYNKSLLYLVSNAFESTPRIPLFRDGIAVLGMEKFIKEDAELLALFNTKTAELVLCPNSATEGSVYHSTAKAHGDFDDDNPTVKATLGRITGSTVVTADISFKSSASSLKARRKRLS
jgi:hypothetical protein